MWNGWTIQHRWENEPFLPSELLRLSMKYVLFTKELFFTQEFGHLVGDDSGDESWWTNIENENTSRCWFHSVMVFEAQRRQAMHFFFFSWSNKYPLFSARSISNDSVIIWEEVYSVE